MKHIHILIVFCAILSFNSVHAVAQDRVTPDIGLESDLLSKNDNLIQVAFRAADKNDLPGGISTINMTELLDKSYALGSTDFLENAIGGFNGNIWGMSEYLVLVDGFPRDANNVLPTEIEQITVLKGAAAVVLYGSRAAKGVVQITTKRGKVGDNKISIRANSGMRTPKEFPKYLGSAEYMTLYNEARVNDGLTPLYTDVDIYNHGSGINPYRYPDLNYYSSDYLKKAYNRSEAIAEITGGTQRAR